MDTFAKYCMKKQSNRNFIEYAKQLEEMDKKVKYYLRKVREQIKEDLHK